MPLFIWLFFLLLLSLRRSIDAQLIGKHDKGLFSTISNINKVRRGGSLTRPHPGATPVSALVVVSLS